MHVFVERTKEKKTVSFKGTVAQLLSQLHINSETVLVSRNNELLTETDVLAQEDNIQILSVVSGG
ncbi:MAG TPA: MoaD/ThiS family protein [Candidatus Nanoarchaeia archaeon]|nr:MoaD/ThiS family protein [Candidatus Nanoarchaeia archaeon]